MSLSNVNLHLVETYDDVTACLYWLAHTTTSRLGFDTEGTGLSPETDTVRLVQFGDRFEGWAIELDRWYGLVEEVVSRWVRGGGRFVAHNAPYDIAMLRKHGIIIPVHLVDDTMPLAHIADPTVSIGLKPQSARHVDAKAASMQSQLDELMHSAGWTWATIPVTPTGPARIYWTYGALDPVLTVHLWDHHAATLKQAPRAYDLELAIGWLAEKMERKGALVDREYASAQSVELVAMYEDMTKQGRSQFGVELGSNESVVKALLADNVPLWKRTETGWSLDKFALEGLDHPLVKLFQRRKYVEKLNSTYLRRFLEYSEFDGRLHPNINTLGFEESQSGSSEFGVVTSRMSMSRPNLQQLTRVGDDPLSRIARNCIVAAPGHTLLTFDFDQVEQRLLAHLSGDSGLAEALTGDEDFFVALTRRIYKDDSIVKGDPRRNIIKTHTYATNYGAGLDKLATTLKLPLGEVEQIDADVRAAYPRVAEFKQAVQRVVAQRLREEGTAYVVSPLTGRHFRTRENDKLYRLVNSLIQGMAAEIMKMKLLETEAAGLGDYLELVVHDEEILEVPDNELSDAAATLKDIMNDDTLLSIPLTSGGATAKRWADKTDLED